MSSCQKDVELSKNVKMSKRCQNAHKMSNCQNDVKFQKVKQLNMLTLAIFGHIFLFVGVLYPSAGTITSNYCRGGHKLQFEWDYIKIGQELPSEISK